MKLVWNCPRATRSYLVQQVLSCGSTSAWVEILSRYCKFFRGLCSSPCREVATLARLLARDIRSTTGRNILLVSNQSGCNVWEDNLVRIRAKLKESEMIDVEQQNRWRLSYLSSLLEQRQTWHYRGEQEKVAMAQQLINSLCIN